MQPPPPSTFHNRAMTPVRNPVYIHNDNADFKRTSLGINNVLERPPANPEARLTAEGSRPPVHGLTEIVPMAGQTPYNVWGLYPA